MTNSLVIDPEFAALHRPLTIEETVTLEADVEAHGILSKLVVWKEEAILLDGHHRLAIAKRLKLKSGEIPIAEMEFASRNEALTWAINNQLGRRNIHSDEASELRGRRYLLEKKAPHRPEGAQNDHLSEKTANKLATEYGVAPATIRRDAEYAEALDTIREVAPTLAPVLTKPGAFPKTEVIEVAEDLREHPSKADAYLESAIIAVEGEIMADAIMPRRKHRLRDRTDVKVLEQDHNLKRTNPDLQFWVDEVRLFSGDLTNFWCIYRHMINKPNAVDEMLLRLDRTATSEFDEARLLTPDRINKIGNAMIALSEAWRATDWKASKKPKTK